MSIHGKVSDNASNMAKGWAGFEGGFCVDHTIELSVKKYGHLPLRHWLVVEDGRVARAMMSPTVK